MPFFSQKFFFLPNFINVLQRKLKEYENLFGCYFVPVPAKVTWLLYAFKNIWPTLRMALAALDPGNEAMI